MRLKITMLQQSEYWSLVRVRLYALDAQLVRRGDVSTAEYQNIAYIYAFFKMQEYIGDVIRRVGADTLSMYITSVDWKSLLEKNVTASHIFENTLLEDEIQAARQQIPSLMFNLTNMDASLNLPEDVAETLEYMASPTERAMSLLNIDWNDRYFSELVYTSALIKTIQLVGEEMSKTKNIHMRERYGKIPWDCFIDIRPVLAHYMYEQIDISRLEEIADKDIPHLISAIGDIIGESGLDLEI